MSDLILASTSPYRRELLSRLGLKFEQCAPNCDEDALKNYQLAPREFCSALAAAKARSVREQYPNAIIIGSDQVCAANDQILDKPGSHAAAVAQLQKLAGDSHRLFTVLHVIQGDRELTDCNVTTLHMRALNTEEIERYQRHDQAYDCAGAYKLERLGISLFDRIDTSDQSAITGLPLLSLCAMLRELGVSIP